MGKNGAARYRRAAPLPIHTKVSPAAALTRSRLDTVIGALPLEARSLFLAVPAAWLCGKLTGYSSDQPGLARALLAGHGAGDGQAAVIWSGTEQGQRLRSLPQRGG